MAIAPYHIAPHPCGIMQQACMALHQWGVNACVHGACLHGVRVQAPRSRRCWRCCLMRPWGCSTCTSTSRPHGRTARRRAARWAATCPLCTRRRSTRAWRRGRRRCRPRHGGHGRMHARMHACACVAQHCASGAKPSMLPWRHYTAHMCAPAMCVSHGVYEHCLLTCMRARLRARLHCTAGGACWRWGWRSHTASGGPVCSTTRR